MFKQKIIKKIIYFIFIFLCNFNFYAQGASIINVKISKIKPRDKYKIQLIKLFLKKAKVPFKIFSLNYFITKSREFEEMKTGKLINVALFTSVKKYESVLIPIRFPIYRGLIGYRIFFINKNKQNLFKSIRYLSQLKQLTCAQGLNWADSDILQAAGFKVLRIKYGNIFKMLNKDRGIYYFPRGTYEIFFERDMFSSFYPNIVIEKKLMIHYPLGMYLYISPNTPKLAKALKKGFKEALKDGSLKRLQEGYIIGNYTIKKILKFANVNKRKIFEIPNPFLTEKSRVVLSNYCIKIIGKSR